jgi:hypothetical protein
MNSLGPPISPVRVWTATFHVNASTSSKDGMVAPPTAAIKFKGRGEYIEALI